MHTSATLTIILAALMLFGACSSSRHQQGVASLPSSASELTREGASAMLEGFYRGRGIRFAGLPQSNVTGGMVDEAGLYFEYRPADGALVCSALIYRFHDEPKPGVIEGFREEERNTPAGGGVVEYEPENRGLYLTRVYRRSVPEEAFADDMKRLMEASLVWGTDVLDRVATRVFEKK